MQHSSNLWNPAASAVGAIASGPQQGAQQLSFQQRVQPWLLTCFGAEIAADKGERNHRFLEEAVELVQACGCTRDEAHQLVDYVFDRPVGEPSQEAGGTMVTLAALCGAQGLDMHAAGETELARIWTKVEQIRAKQAAKPKHSPLPGCVTATRNPASPGLSTHPWPAESSSLPRQATDVIALVDAYAVAYADQVSTGHESAKAYAAIARSNLLDALTAAPADNIDGEARFDPAARARLIALAKDCAATDPERHSYTRGARAADWAPHEWVLKAMARAAQDGGKAAAHRRSSFAEGYLDGIHARYFPGAAAARYQWADVPALLGQAAEAGLVRSAEGLADGTRQAVLRFANALWRAERETPAPAAGEIRAAGDAVRSSSKLPAAQLKPPASCWCEACDAAAHSGQRSRMAVCPNCRSKRCARASHHENACGAEPDA